MKDTDTISVLVCVHSTTHDNDMLLQRALESLVAQTYPDFETVVVLDECWEDTRSVVERYAEVLDLRFYERPCKQGLAAAKNYGLGKCEGDWITYLDADDEWMPCKLEVQREFMLENSGIDFCGTHAWDRIDDVLYPNCFKVTEGNDHQEIVRSLRRENIMCHGSMMIRNIALATLGGYTVDDKFLGCEDWELWARAVNAGFMFAKVPERLYIYSMGTSVVRGKVEEEEDEGK